MKNTIEDIRERLQRRDYSNEEHIRFSLVGRILQELGWNVWNPKEVYTEFPAIKSEDNTRVDIALFSRTSFPDVYIEVKPHSRIDQNLSSIEKQLRDYNRNNQATFTIITDGQRWLFYYSLSQGEFADRRYHEINLMNNDVQQIEDDFQMLLSKESVVNGDAKKRAEEYLKLSHKERAIRDALPEAIKRTETNPLLSRVHAIKDILVDKGFIASDDEIILVLQRGTIVNQAQSEKPEKIELPKQPIITRKLPIAADQGSTTVIKVSLNGKEFYHKDALQTFKEVIRFLGTERVIGNTSVKCKWPLIVPEENLKKYPEEKYAHLEGRYYIYKNNSTFRKKQFLDIISAQLREKIKVDIVPK